MLGPGGEVGWDRYFSKPGSCHDRGSNFRPLIVYLSGGASQTIASFAFTTVVFFFRDKTSDQAQILFENAVAE